MPRKGPGIVHYQECGTWTTAGQGEASCEGENGTDIYHDVSNAVAVKTTELKLLDGPAQVTVPHAPKTLAKLLGQLRQGVRGLQEEDQDAFFSLHNARPQLCTKNRGRSRRLPSLHSLQQYLK